MAVWQFELFFIPEGTVEPVLSDEGWALPLIAEPSVVQAHAWLSSRFGAPWAMCEGILVFGAEDGNRIDLVVDHEGEAEMSARIDARSEANEFCGLIAELATATDCKLFSPELGRCLAGSQSAVVTALTLSVAWNYAVDPKDTLRRLSGGG